MYQVNHKNQAVTVKNLKTGEVVRMEFVNGKMQIQTTVDTNQTKYVVKLAAFVRNHVKNFTDKKRDYAQRMKSAADILRNIEGSNSLRTMVQNF